MMLDEMTIKKNISWDLRRHKYSGFVDLGNDADDDDSMPVAKDALVFMLVHINGSWKVPCAYFLIDGMNGNERANLVSICIQRLADVGVTVVSLTCDGPSCHRTMITSLGGSLKWPTNVDGSFPHPSKTTEKVHVFLDVCHMMKLVRNTLGDWKVLTDSDKKYICWQYLVDLQTL